MTQAIVLKATPMLLQEHYCSLHSGDMGAKIKGWWNSLNRFVIMHIYIMIMPKHLCILIHEQIKPWSGKKHCSCTQNFHEFISEEVVKAK